MAVLKEWLNNNHSFFYIIIDYCVLLLYNVVTKKGRLIKLLCCKNCGELNQSEFVITDDDIYCYKCGGEVDYIKTDKEMVIVDEK